MCHSDRALTLGTSPSAAVAMSQGAESWWCLGWARKTCPSPVQPWRTLVKKAWKEKAGRSGEDIKAKSACGNRGRLLLPFFSCVLQMDTQTGMWPGHSMVMSSPSCATQPESRQCSTKQMGLTGVWKLPTMMGRNSSVLPGWPSVRPHRSSWHQALIV